MKQNSLLFYHAIFYSILILITSCVEEFIPENLTFESLLVVEASVTNELKNHEIRLSRTFKFNDEPLFESGAQVSVVDEFQNVNNFIEMEPGTYLSVDEFAIQPNVNYRLEIITKDNAAYESAPIALPNSSGGITDVTYSRRVNANNKIGLDILVDSFDPSGNSRYYRYEYEETYRIIPPWYRVLEIIVISDTPPFEVATQPRNPEERECYNTLYSDGILQTQTNGFSEDRITKFPIKFIPSDTTIIRDRYSILVKQYVQSLDAYTYFNTLNEFSNSESVFSENQPGFLNGNIFSKTNSDEKVIGFFEIASVTSKRIFFNYGDVFSDLPRPPFFAECSEFETPFLTDPANPLSSPLIDKIKNNEVEYVEDNADFFGNLIENQPYVVINRECGDCTVFGTNIKPDFWID